jgi:hypothetical protein
LVLKAVTQTLYRLGGSLNADKSIALLAPGADPAKCKVYAWEIDEYGQCVESDKEIKTTCQLGDKHKLLGVDLDSGMHLKVHREAQTKAMVQRLGRIGAVTCANGWFDPRLMCISLNQAYSGMLYCCELWASTEKAYQVRLRRALAAAARTALEVPSVRTPTAGVLGELGLQSPEVRVYQARLAWYFECLIQPPHSAEAHAYAVDRAAFEAGTTAANWCRQTKLMLQQMQLGEWWERGRQLLEEHFAVPAPADEAGAPGTASEDEVEIASGPLPAPDRMGKTDLLAAWRAKVRSLARTLARQWGEDCWLAELHSSKQRGGALTLLSKLCHDLKFRRYLDQCANDPEATKLRERIRLGIFPTADTVARWFPERLARADGKEAGTCRMCEGGVEDATHFILRCPATAAQRADLSADIRAACKSKAMCALLDGTPEGEERDFLDVALVLGGDLSQRDGLAQMMLPRSKITGDEPHPAADRLAVLRLSGSRIRAMAHERADQMRAAQQRKELGGWPDFTVPAHGIGFRS